MKQLVIITHRYHYHICQATLLTALKHFTFDRIAILFDDVVGTQVGWNKLGKTLLSDIKKLVNLPPGVVYSMPFSAINNVHVEASGWIRQQYVKLNLHKILTGDEWLVIDGDVLLNKQIDPYEFCYINPEDNLKPHHDIFTRYVLDLKENRSLFKGKPVEFSSVPIRLLKRSTLEELEKYIFKLHKKNIIEIRNSFTLLENKEFYFELSEYDLIGNFQNFILKDLQPLCELECYYTLNETFVNSWDFLKNHIAVLHGYDNLPIDFYQSLGVNINQDIWNLLYT